MRLDLQAHLNVYAWAWRLELLGPCELPNLLGVPAFRRQPFAITRRRGCSSRPLEPTQATESMAMRPLVDLALFRGRSRSGSHCERSTSWCRNRPTRIPISY